VRCGSWLIVNSLTADTTLVARLSCRRIDIRWISAVQVAEFGCEEVVLVPTRYASALAMFSRTPTAAPSKCTTSG
jgi:hypothetical protein